MMVTEVTGGLEGVLCHMDDILVWGQTQEEHHMRLHAVLEKTQKTCISLNMDKCELMPQSPIPWSCDFSRWIKVRFREDESSLRDGCNLIPRIQKFRMRLMR